ncbi:MAG: thioredoxin family protein [Atopobiaceae bacterium]|nr:thioredoxin family protein [Atopobiaceae bacterium]
MATATVWHAKWCGPCRWVIASVVPMLEAAGYDVTLMDVDDHPCAARDAGIDQLPVIVATLEDGSEVVVRGRPGTDALGALGI